MTTTETIDRFTAMAQGVSAVVHRAPDLAGAMALAVELCEAKEACTLLPSGCELPLSDAGEALCDGKQRKVVAAPGLSQTDFTAFDALCADKDFALVSSGLRGHLAGIDVGFAVADAGIAATGTVVLGSTDEEVRLSSMLCEVFVAALPVSRLVPDSAALAETLRGRMAAAPDFTAFITGPSRTADIERVLALGVHGPLEMHVVLVEEG